MNPKKHILRAAASQWTRAFLFWCAVFALIIAATQFILPDNERRISDSDIENYRKYYRDIFNPFFKKDNDGIYRPATQHISPTSFSAQKPKNTWRAFIVGGSAAQNLANSSDMPKFNDFLQHKTGKRPEIINAGIAGYDSFRVLRVVREVLDYNPDCLIIMSGNNEIFYPQRLNAGLYYFNMLRHAKLFRFLLRSADKHRRTRTYPQRCFDFETNINKMLKLAHARAVPTVLCTLPVNFRALVPLGNFPADANYIKAALAYWNGEYAEALRKIRLYIRQNPHNPQSLFLLARIYEKTGRRTKAMTFYYEATQMQAEKWAYSNRLMNALIRKTAVAGQAKLADLAKTFDAIWIKGTVKENPMFLDNCHPSQYYSDQLLNTLLRTIIPDPPQIIGRKLPCTNINTAKAYWNQLITMHDNQYPLFLQPKMFYVFQQTVIFSSLGNIRNLIRTTVPAKDRPCFYMYAGEALRRMGEKTHARRFLKRAQESGLGAWPLFLSLSLLEHDAGNTKDAREHMNRAIRKARRNAEKPDRRMVRNFKDALFSQDD